MNEQEKELLLKDICSRLMYGVKCYFEKDGGKAPVHVVTIGLLADVANRDDVICKPYLRPMSSMAEEEIEEYHNLCTKQWNVHIDDYWYYDTVESIDWLNANHFDYRGLIEKGLALEAPADMYK